MEAYWVLLSMLVLLGLLVHGRLSPAVLFTSLAAGYYLLGWVGQSTLLASYTNPALVTLLVLLMVSVVLERSPLMTRLSEGLFRGSQRAATLRLTGVAALLSAFLNNTAVVGSLMGVVTRQRRFPASQLLIPLSYASVLGGVTTLVGTSTNLVVNSFVVGAGLAPLEMFQFTAVGVPVALVCLLVLAFSARLLPRASADETRDTTQAYFLEARVRGDSPLVGHSIEANRLRRLDGLFLVEIIRRGRLISPVAPQEVLLDGDVLIFSGAVEKIQVLHQFAGLEVFGVKTDELLASNLVEVVISHESELVRRTLREVDFRTLFGAAVVAIRRGERPLTGHLGQIRLHVGDSLVLAVGSDFAQRRNIDRNFHMLRGSLLRPRLKPLQNLVAVGGFATVIGLATAGVASLFAGLLVLLGAMLALRVVSPWDLRRRFPFDLLLIIGSALTLAEVIKTSGAAALIAGAIEWAFSGYGVWGAMLGIYLLTVLLTELVTNNAAAALAFPIALSTAEVFGADPMPFIMLVLFGASACFLMPFGYQTHLMVHSSGRYRLADFFKVGLPVSFAYGAMVLVLVPRYFPL